MSEAFTKLFHSITTSTIWMQPDNVRLVWITMLALADKDGVVRASVPGLAHVARVELVATEQALKVLGEPDPYSRSPENDGRRIEEVDGGWRLINHAKYRNTRDMEDRREYERTRKAEQRAKHSGPGQSGTGPECPVLSAHTEAEADTEKTKRERRATALPPDFDLTDARREYALSKGVLDPDAEFEKFRAHHEAHGKTMRSWDAAWRTWCLNFKKWEATRGTSGRRLSAVEQVRAANPMPGEGRELLPHP